MVKPLEWPELYLSAETLLFLYPELRQVLNTLPCLEENGIRRYNATAAMLLAIHYRSQNEQSDDSPFTDSRSVIDHEC